MSEDLTSLNWLSALSAADRTIVDAIAQSCSNPARVYATTISDPAGASLPALACHSQQSATRHRGSNHAARSRAPYRPADRLGSDIQPVDGNKYPRPACSYSCLIAMALKACSTGCLPVSEIYRFIEREYPYYKTAPDGWKNSIRHNLSLNASFCKAERPDGLQMKKGCYWMINPERLHIVESEIEKFLMQEGRSLVENGEQLCGNACPPAYPVPERVRSRPTTRHAPRRFFHQSPASFLPSSLVNCQKMNSIFGINIEPFTSSSIVPPSQQSWYGLPLTGADRALQELFDGSLTQTLLTCVDDSGVTFLHTTPTPSIFPDSLCDQFGELIQAEDYVLGSQPTDIEYSIFSSPSSSSCSSSSSQSSLKAVDKILTNVTSSQLALPALHDEVTKILNPPPANLDELLSKLVEERLRNPCHDFPREQSPPYASHEEGVSTNPSAFHPVVTSTHELPAYICDGDSDMDDDCDNGVTEEEEERHTQTSTLVAPPADSGTAERESVFSLSEIQELEEEGMEAILDDGVLDDQPDTLTMDVGNILGNLFQESDRLPFAKPSSSYPVFPTGVNTDTAVKRTTSTPR